MIKYILIFFFTALSVIFGIFLLIYLNEYFQIKDWVNLLLVFSIPGLINVIMHWVYQQEINN